MFFKLASWHQTNAASDLHFKCNHLKEIKYETMNIHIISREHLCSKQQWYFDHQTPLMARKQWSNKKKDQLFYSPSFLCHWAVLTGSRITCTLQGPFYALTSSLFAICIILHTYLRLTIQKGTYILCYYIFIGEYEKAWSELPSQNLQQKRAILQGYLIKPIKQDS